MGQTGAEHYGHKNVVLRHLEDDRVPARVIDSGGFTKSVLGNVPILSVAWREGRPDPIVLVSKPGE